MTISVDSQGNASTASQRVNKKIYDPKRGTSVGAQNKEALKKTGAAIKRKARQGVSYAKGTTRVLKKGGVLAAAGAATAATVDNLTNLSDGDVSARGGQVLSGMQAVGETVVGIGDDVHGLFTGKKETGLRTGLRDVQAKMFAEGGRYANKRYTKARGEDPSDPQTAAGINTQYDQTLASEQERIAQERGGELPSAPSDTFRKLTGNGGHSVAAGQSQPYVGAPQAVEEQNFAGTKLTKNEGYNEDGTYSRTLRNAQDEVVGTMDTQRRTSTDSPESVNATLQGISQRSIARGQASLDAKRDANPAYQRSKRIKELTEQLAQPGRGLRQSFGDLLTETRGRQTARKELDALNRQQEASITQAGQNQRAGLVSQDKARDRALRFRELVGKQGAAAKVERRALMAADQKVFEAQAKDRDMTAEQTAFFVASNLELGMPGSSWNTAYGKLARKDAMAEFVTEWSSERGIWDWGKSFLGIGDQRAPTQDDIERADFSKFTTDKGEMITPDWLIDNRVIKSPSGDYVYLDNLPPKVAWLITQRIIHDNPDNFKNVKQSLRKGN